MFRIARRGPLATAIKAAKVRTSSPFCVGVYTLLTQISVPYSLQSNWCLATNKSPEHS